jgi:hypothetical protein
MKAITLTALILLISPSPAAAQWVGKNEKKWVDSISSDIRNGAPADAICSKEALNKQLFAGNIHLILAGEMIASSVWS